MKEQGVRSLAPVFFSSLSCRFKTLESLKDVLVREVYVIDTHPKYYFSTWILAYTFISLGIEI